MKKRAYLSGPMSGHDLYNFPAFFEAEEFLKDQGWKVVNPARLDIDLGFVPSLDEPMSHEAYMKRDLPLLVACDAIALLPEWWTSKGAKQELSVALMCGLDVISATDGLPLHDFSCDICASHEHGLPLRDWFGDYGEPQEPPDPPESPLSAAMELVHADRGKAYGPPFQDLGRTGRIWGAILGTPDVSPEQVALCMVGVKISREVNAHGRDNLVDMAGYTEVLAVLTGETAS